MIDMFIVECFLRNHYVQEKKNTIRTDVCFCFIEKLN